MNLVYSVGTDLDQNILENAEICHKIQKYILQRIKVSLTGF